MNILDHYKQSHDLRTSEDYEVSINDQGAGLGAPAPVEGRFFYPEGDAPRPQYEGDMLERTGQALEDVGQTAKSMAVGAGAGMAGLPGDVVALTGGLARLLFPGDEGRIQGATDTITKISEAIGSERFLGLYRDLVNESDMSAEDKQMALDAAETGSFFSLPGAVPAAQAVKRGAKAYAAGAPARVAERQSGTTLPSGVDPTAMIDDAIVSVGGRAVRNDDVMLSKAGESAIKNVGSDGSNTPLTKGNLEKADEVTQLLVSKILEANPDAPLSLVRSGSAAGDSNYLTFVDPDGKVGQIRISDHSTGERRMSDYFEMLPMKIPPEGKQVFGQISKKSFDDRVNKIVQAMTPPKTDPNQAAGAAMDAAQARYFETGKFEPPTAENPVSVVKPTEQEPGIIAFHGSGADFDEFRLEMIGTGEGAQAYGYGLYFTDSKDIAKFYKEAMEQPKYLELEGKPLDSVYTADNEEKFADYVNRNFDPEEHDDVYVVLDNLGQGLFSLDDADALSQSSFRQGAQKQIYQKIKKDLVEPEVSEGKMYKVGLAPAPEDMLDYQGTFADQTKKVQDALKAIGYEVETNRVGQKKSAISN